MDQKTIDELAKLGIHIVPLGNPAEMHKRLAELLDEEYQLDHNEHKQNKEWASD